MPPIIVLFSGRFCDFCPRVHPRDAIRGQSMFRLSTEGGILCFQSGKTIDGNLTIRDRLLNSFDAFRRLYSRLRSKNAISNQSIVLLKPDCGSFGACSPNPVDLAPIISEIV